MSSKNKKRDAFSLAELVIIVAIMSLLFGLARPRMISYVEKDRVRVLSRRIALDLAMARSEAIKRRSPVTVKFDSNGSGYEIPQIINVHTVDGLLSKYRVEIEGSNEFKAEIVGVDFGGVSEVSFDRFGIPNSEGTIEIASGEAGATIEVNMASGEVQTTLLRKSELLLAN